MAILHRFSKLLDNIWEHPRKDYLLPVSLQFGALLIFGFFYIGCAYQENAVRTYGYILGQFLFVVLCGLAFLSAIKHTKLSRISWLCLSLVLLFYGCYFIVGIARFGLDAILKDNFIHFVCMTAAFFAGIYGAASRSEQRFLSLMEQISFFVFPAGLIYFNGLIFNCNPFRDPNATAPFLGIIGYLPLAYTLMPFLLVHIIRFSTRETLELPITHKNAAHPQLLRGIFMAVYWIALIGSGTRGTYLCVTGFCVLFVLSRLIHREPVGRAMILSFILAAVLLFNIFVYAPPAMRAVRRMNIIFEGLKQGQLVTGRGETEGIQEKLDDLVNAGVDHQVASQHPEQSESPNVPENPNTPESPNMPENPNTPGNETPSEPPKEMVKIGSRGTLYKLAIKEFLNSPLTGMGPGRFKFKYGMYPHNLLLELIADTGLLGTIPMLSLVLFSFLKLIKAGWTDCKIRYYFLFLLAFAMKAMVSGGICDSVVFLGGLGYGLAFQVPSEPLKKAEAQSLANVVSNDKPDEKT